MRLPRIPSPCPSKSELSAFNAGELETESTVAEIAEHLESCGTCLDRLQRLGFRATRSGDGPADDDWSDTYYQETQCQEALKQIAAIPAVAGSTTPGAPPDVDAEIAGYRVIRRLGAGGMGTVYEAWHPRLERAVVLKMVREPARNPAVAAEQFRREMAMLGRIDHPLIVKAYDAPVHDGREYLVMEFVAGENLRELLRRNGPFDLADACAVAHEVAVGLQYLHERGIVHRDVKPSNVVVSETGHVKILDLGLAIAAAPREERSRTSAGPVAAPDVASFEGTLDYMAPEQAVDSRTATPSADLHALGATLYHLLVGRAPHAEMPTRDEKLAALVSSARQAALEFPREIPLPLRRLVERLLAKKPEDRPASAKDVAHVLRPFAERSRRIRTTHDAAPDRRRRTRWPVAVALLAIAAVIAVVWYLDDTPSPNGDHSSQLLGPVDKSPAELVGSTPDTATREAASMTAASPAAPQRPGYKPWKSGSSQRQLVGLASSPPLFSGLARWQVETVRPRGFVRAIAASPDGRHVALASDDGAVRVFDRHSPSSGLSRLFPAESPSPAPRSLAWNPDGELLASASAQPDRPIDLWDWRAGRRVAELRGHAGEVVALAWSPDGRTLASAGRDARLALWSREGLLRRAVDTLKVEPRALDWHPSGTRLTVGAHDGTVIDFDLEGEASDRPHAEFAEPILALAWRPTGDQLAVVTQGHTLRVFAPSRDAAPRTLAELRISAPFRSLAWIDDGQSLIVVTNQGPLVWKQGAAAFATMSAGPPIPEAWAAGAWSSSTQTLTLVSVYGKQRHVARDGMVSEPFSPPDVYLRDLAWNRDSTRVAICSVGGHIQLCGGQGRPYGTLSARDSMVHGVRRAAWNVSSKWLAAAELPPRNRVHLWDAESCEELDVWEHPEPIEDLAWTDDDRWIAVVGGQGTVRLWDRTHRRPGPSPTFHSATVTSVSVLPHTRKFATGDVKGHIHVWEVDDQGDVSLIASWSGQREPVWCVAWSPLGDRLAVTGAPRHAWLLDGRTGQELWSLACLAPPGKAFWHPSGERLYFNGAGMVQASDGVVVQGAAAQPEPAAYSPDGRRVVDATSPGVVTARHASHQAVQWRAAPVSAEAFVTFGASGQILYHVGSFDEPLAYVAEPRRGDYVLYRPSEFERHVQRRISK